MEKEIKITSPEGYEIDRENSTFECIKFKPIVKRWRDSNHPITGYSINNYVDDHIGTSEVIGDSSIDTNIFATQKQAKSALAMAQISQIMANDERFGGVIADEEWEQDYYHYVIFRRGSSIVKSFNIGLYRFLAFHTEEQRDLFLEENEDLVKDYLMLD